MKRIYLPGVKYGIHREILWDCMQVPANSPGEAREKLREFLFGVNGRFRIYEQTKDGPVLVDDDE